MIKSELFIIVKGQMEHIVMLTKTASGKKGWSDIIVGDNGLLCAFLYHQILSLGWL